MRLRTCSFALLGLFSLAALQPVQAQVTAAPALMNFQGRLAKPDGTPVSDGTYSIQFSLYDAVTAGNQKWTQTVSTVTVKNGSFAVLLSGFPAATFNGNLWLEIKIGTAAALTPRQQMVSVAFAMKANTVPDGSIGAAQIANGSITAAKLATGVIPTTLPPSGAAGGSLTGTYPNPTVAANAIGNAELTSDSASLAKVSGGVLSTATGFIADSKGFEVDSGGLNNGTLLNALLFGLPNTGEGIASKRTTGGNQYGIDFYTGSNNRLSVTNTGNVGIGTATPAFLLDIAGTAQMTGFRLPTGAGASKILTSDASGVGTWQTAPATGATGAAGGDLTGTYPNPAIAASAIGYAKLASDYNSLSRVSGGNIFAVSSGHIGIGTIYPLQTLDVNGGISVDNGIIQRGGATLTASTDLGLYSQLAGQYVRFVTNGGNFQWYADSSTGTNAIMTLQPTGELTASVVTITGGSDVAEPYNVAASAGIKPVPGMLVCIDDGKVGQMRVANRAYDNAVAGIISGANGISPGITLRQKGTVADGQLPVASIGRVWAFCDADANGAIKAGDLLTSSDTPGHAMKATDRDRRDGAVIGKAMSGLASGRGLVLVLVSLK